MCRCTDYSNISLSAFYVRSEGPSQRPQVWRYEARLATRPASARPKSCTLGAEITHDLPGNSSIVLEMVYGHATSKARLRTHGCMQGGVRTVLHPLHSAAADHATATSFRICREVTSITLAVASAVVLEHLWLFTLKQAGQAH